MGRREAFLLRSLRFFAGKSDRRLFGLGLILGPQTATVRRGPAQPRRHLAIRSTPRRTHECASGFDGSRGGDNAKGGAVYSKFTTSGRAEIGFCGWGETAGFAAVYESRPFARTARWSGPRRTSTCSFGIYSTQSRRGA